MDNRYRKLLKTLIEQYVKEGQPIGSKAIAESSKLDISAEWWKDNSNGGQDNGNYLTYCCIDMTARDFIKFGQLLLNDGLWENERILSPSYVQQIKDLTTYGLKFWPISSNYISSPSPSVSKFIFAIGFPSNFFQFSNASGQGLQGDRWLKQNSDKN